MLLASHSLHFRVHTRVFVTLLVALAIVACAWAGPTVPELLQSAATARKAGDPAAVITALEAAHRLRPDYPRVTVALARAYASATRPADACALLDSLAAMGLVLSPERDPALAAAVADPAYTAVAARFAANTRPRGDVRTRFTLPARDGIIEGLAADAAGNFYFGDVHDRCIWRRTPSGAVTRFTPESAHLLGVFGLAVDPATSALWAATSAVPEMAGYAAPDEGRAALVELDLATGDVRRTFPLPADGRKHVLGDLALTPAGVFATDSLAPVIWRLAPGGEHLQRWLESPDFASLQGIVPAPDGRHLLVADYANGLWQIALADGVHALLPPPPAATLFGIDGLYRDAAGLVATQNGVEPARIVRLTLAADGRPVACTVLAANDPGMTDVSLGTVCGDRFVWIGDSGWARYDPPSATPAPRDVPILETPL